MNCHKCGRQKYREGDALACHSENLEYCSQQDAKLSCLAKMSRGMEIKVLKMKRNFLFYVPKSFIPDMMYRLQNCNRF